jgi:hypothetical protein
LVAENVSLRLVVDGSSPAVLPVTAAEVRRLVDDPKAEKHTVLGGLVRRAWFEARGADTGKKSKGRVSLEAVRGPQLLGRYEMPSLDATIGRPNWVKRLGGKSNTEPQLEDTLGGALNAAMLRAELLEQAGRPRAREILERLRAGEQSGIGERERAVILKITGN